MSSQVQTRHTARITFRWERCNIKRFRVQHHHQRRFIGRGVICHQTKRELYPEIRSQGICLTEHSDNGYQSGALGDTREKAVYKEVSTEEVVQ